VLRTSWVRFQMSGEKKQRGMGQADSMRWFAFIQNLRPRICCVLALFRIHSSDCKQCSARLTCGEDLRKRLEELNGLKQPCAHENADHGALRRSG
jgi:hypothetical protein